MARRPPPSDAARLLNRALDLGYDLIDTAALYGFGANERLIGEAIGHRRSEYRAGLEMRDDRRRRQEGDRRPARDAAADPRGKPAAAPHRDDRPLLSPSLGQEGADRGIGRRARRDGRGRQGPGDRAQRGLGRDLAQGACGPSDRGGPERIFALVAQRRARRARRRPASSAPPWSPFRRPRAAFSPARIHSAADLEEGDLRRSMPRFQDENLGTIWRSTSGSSALAGEAGCTPAQLSLAWVLSRGDHVIPIPGTTSSTHLEENFAAGALDGRAGNSRRDRRTARTRRDRRRPLSGGHPGRNRHRGILRRSGTANMSAHPDSG